MGSETKDPTSFLNIISDLASLSVEFSDALFSKMSENGLSSKIVAFIENFPVDNYRDAPSSLSCILKLCPRDGARGRLMAYQSVCDFVLKIGFLSKDTIFYSTLVLALKRSRYLSTLADQLHCRGSSARTRNPILLEESSTPFKNGNSRCWKEVLANDLLGDAHSQYTKIVNIVELVCRDLEHRCTTVESPLREAEAKIEKLERTLEDISRNNLSLTEECAELRREVEVRETECAATIHELKCARTEIEGCQRELRNSSSAWETAVAEFEKERRAWRQRETELTATVQVHDDGLKEAHAQLEEDQRRVCSL